MKDLEGKVAVVTGAASGIGLGLATRFAQEGMKVVLADVEQPAPEAAITKRRQQDVEVLGCALILRSMRQYKRWPGLQRGAMPRLL